jgi:hypothetical protein
MRTPRISFKKGYLRSMVMVILSMILPLAVHEPSPAICEIRSSLSIGTDRIGSLFNSLGNGYAKVISQYSKIAVIVRPFSGPDAWQPSQDQGELELGSIAAPVAWYSYNAAGPPYSTTGPVKNVRLLLCVPESSLIGAVVRKGSDVKTIRDLKGKRVPYVVGHAGTQNNIRAALMTEGLDWDDVIKVPVPGVVDIMRAFGDGRADMGWAPVGQPALRELDVKLGGVRFLPVKGDPKSLEILRSILGPANYVAKAKKNSSPGILEDTLLISYDSYLTAWAGLDDETTTLIVSTLWNRTEDLRQIHPGFKSFTNEAAVTTRPMIPYHPAAIRFYKEKGIWKDEANTVVNK